MLHEHLSWLRGIAVDTEARIYFRVQPASDWKEISGQLHGPHCAVARTLPTSFGVRQLPETAGEPCLSEVVVTDPCFWSPQLPFLYNLKLDITTQTGDSLRYEMAVGLKRWYVDGGNWSMDGKRIVLRGAAPPRDAEQILASAGETETALYVPRPDDATLVSASQRGIPLLVDCRSSALPADRDAGGGERLKRDSVHRELDRLTWSPAVMAVVCDADQLATRPPLAAERSGPLPLGLAVNAESFEREVEKIAADFYAVELRPGESPPDWLTRAAKPVIAIRRGESYVDLAVARNACDRLQAELAPQFDLAGYFVTS